MLESGFLEVGGVRLEARWAGPQPESAPTLVFLHEGLGSASLWRDFPDRLAAETGCGALVYSRAGYGKSDPIALPRPVRFMHDEAAILPAVLAAAGVREHVLIGHSDGASISLIHAGSAPSPGLRGLRGLILEAPHVFTEPHGLASIARIREAYRDTDLRARLARHHGANVDVAFRGWNDVWLDPGVRGLEHRGVPAGDPGADPRPAGGGRRVRHLGAGRGDRKAVRRPRRDAGDPRLRALAAPGAAGDRLTGHEELRRAAAFGVE